MSRPVVWLIDAHYQIFRAYYSMPDLTAPDGRPVGAFRGYVAVLIKFLARQEPSHVIAAFDHDLTSFRNEIYAEYFSTDGPCRTTIEVNRLPTPIAIELKCIATIE